MHSVSNSSNVISQTNKLAMHVKPTVSLQLIEFGCAGWAGHKAYQDPQAKA